MDSTNVSQIEQTPFTFRGDEQALRTVVDRAVDTLPGSRITSRTLPGHLAPGRLSEAAWKERYTETVRGVEVRRLRAIWIGAGRLEAKGISFSYRCAYIDSADDDAAARIELWQRGIRQRDDESESMRLHVKLSKVQDATITGTIEAPALLRFAVDAILQAIEDAGRAAQTVTPTGDAPSNDAGNTATGAQSDDQAGAPAWANQGWYLKLPIEWRERYDRLRPHKEDWEAWKVTDAKLAELFGKTSGTVATWRRELKKQKAPDMDWHKQQGSAKGSA